MHDDEAVFSLLKLVNGQHVGAFNLLVFSWVSETLGVFRLVHVRIEGVVQGVWARKLEASGAELDRAGFPERFSLASTRWARFSKSISSYDTAIFLLSCLHL